MVPTNDGAHAVIRTGIVGLGKMGLSHLSMIRAHSAIELVGVCDASSYVLSILKKYTGVVTYSDYQAMLDDANLDAVFIATPSDAHAKMVRAALERDINVFCEKPFTLSVADSEDLATLGRERGLSTQVGYHNRYVAAFAEVKRLLDAGAIGDITHALGEAYGPVVLKPKGSTWRTQSTAGGGCLYDYAAHVINLLNWYIGEPNGVGGTVLNKIFSRDTDDEVFSTLYFDGGRSAQVSVNWSDESYRKMTTRVSLWGTAGRIFVDRQECQVYLRDTAKIPDGYTEGWNMRYTTELTAPVWFYLRGEEYSAQIDGFARAIAERRVEAINDFSSATATDRVIGMMIRDAAKGPTTGPAGAVTAETATPRRRRGGIFSRFRRRR
ncbi:MAG: hypothetical protein QOD83_3454 [Solirubrobacteraceae bacterium]|jgi:predicted dehydrogenase|nr:hypothetical protein [Solirubrobacteraceae bacterium]